MTKRKSAAPMQLKIDVAGDQRLTENAILEVRATARRFGLEISNIEFIRGSSNGRKARKPASRQKRRPRA